MNIARKSIGWLPLLPGLIVILSAIPSLSVANAAVADSHRLKVLFLGDQGLHRPVERLRDAAPAMLDRGIELVYTEDQDDINLETLRRYDAFLLYANRSRITEDQERALLEYVETGGGFLPIHTATNNFVNSEAVIRLMGARFDRHGDGVMTTEIAEPDHPLMQGFEPFETWDETRVHRDHNEEGRTVLSYHRRDDGELEPWTWVREQGEGRVFYTAWGHDHHSWRHPGFHDLLERGIRWAAGQDVPRVLAERTIHSPLRYRRVETYPPPPPRLIQTGGQAPFLGEPVEEEAWDLQAEPLSPEESMSRMITPAGFRVELFASEPDVVNPIVLAWDERGRLWVAETVDYPHQVRDGEPGKDRIKVLEDTNGDGRADKITVFADDLNIPTGIAFHRGGVIVKQAPYTLFMKDTTGDGKADHREILIEGWSQWDTHGGPNNIRYGLDNHIWGAVGMAGYEGSVGGRDFSYTANDIFRMKPDGSMLEFVRSLSNNAWGIGLSEEGIVFGATANAQPSTYLPFPQRYYEKVDGLRPSMTEGISSIGPRFLAVTNMLRQNNVYGGFTAAGGHALYTARAYPPAFWNRKALITDITGHLTGSFVLEPRGSSFDAFNKMNLIAGDDAWFSPVAAEVGPDGAVWIADLYEYVSQHLVPGRPAEEHGPGNAYVTDLRDKEHGRIYRIVWEDAEPYQPIDLASAAPEVLVEALRHDNQLWRMHAQRLLVERGEADVTDALIALVDDRSVDAIGLNAGAIHALWTLHGLGQLDAEGNGRALASAYRALEHPSAGVRRNAVQVLPPAPESVERILSAELLTDDNVQVRLATLIALADLPPSGPAGESIFRMLRADENVTDRWIREAGTIAAAVHRDGFLTASSALDVELSAASPEGRLAQVAEMVRTTGFRPETPLPVEETAAGDDDVLVVRIGVVNGTMEFDVEEFQVRRGQRVRIHFINTDHMEHNLLIVRPGALESVGVAADRMSLTPEGLAREYVPDSDEVLHATRMLAPGEEQILEFTAPEEPGDYPYVCTFPGHWRVMNGIMKVE